MLEPGLDRHEWESEWSTLEEELEDDPAGALSDVDELVGRMLEARGYAISDPVASEGDDRDVVSEFLAARETRLLLDEKPDSVSPGDVAAAVNAYRSLYEFLIDERRMP